MVLTAPFQLEKLDGVVSNVMGIKIYGKMVSNFLIIRGFLESSKDRCGDYV